MREKIRYLQLNEISESVLEVIGRNFLKTVEVETAKKLSKKSLQTIGEVVVEYNSTLEKQLLSNKTLPKQADDYLKFDEAFTDDIYDCVLGGKTLFQEVEQTVLLLDRSHPGTFTDPDAIYKNGNDKFKKFGDKWSLVTSQDFLKFKLRNIRIFFCEQDEFFKLSAFSTIYFVNMMNLIKMSILVSANLGIKIEIDPKDFAYLAKDTGDEYNDVINKLESDLSPIEKLYTRLKNALKKEPPKEENVSLNLQLRETFLFQKVVSAQRELENHLIKIHNKYVHAITDFCKPQLVTKEKIKPNYARISQHSIKQNVSFNSSLSKNIGSTPVYDNVNETVKESIKKFQVAKIENDSVKKQEMFKQVEEALISVKSHLKKPWEATACFYLGLCYQFQEKYDDGKIELEYAKNVFESLANSTAGEAKADYAKKTKKCEEHLELMQNNFRQDDKQFGQ